jgi:hypothetical protein
MSTRRIIVPKANQAAKDSSNFQRVANISVVEALCCVSPFRKAQSLCCAGRPSSPASVAGCGAVAMAIAAPLNINNWPCWSNSGPLSPMQVSGLCSTGSPTLLVRKSFAISPGPRGGTLLFFAPAPDVLRRALRPGDILLIEGNTRLSAIIKFLTQSTWSHAALYVGERPGDALPNGEPKVLLEAEVDTGVTTVPLSKYAHFNTRICRAAGLSAEAR